MAFDAFFPKITLPSNKTDVRKGGGLGMRIGKKIMVADAFQGGEATNGLIAWLKDNNAEQIDLAVATHAHGDHTGGFYDIVNAGIPIKEFRCYHIDSIRGGNDASREDSDNLLELIRWLQIRGTRVLFVDHGDVIKFEDIFWHIYRNQPARAAADDTNAWDYVNNGSLVLYSPELQGIIFGDGPENPKDAIAYFQKKFGKIEILIWFLISHHGNHFSLSNAVAAKDAGAKFAYESCVEADGPGTTSWTEFGARRVVQQKITVWMQNQNIYIHAAAGEITFKQGSKTRTFSIPYQREGWQKNATGWWYRYKDGSWPADCMVELPWSKGKSIFCFDKRGYMVIGWRKIEGKWYYFDENGAMVTGWIVWKGAWFYLDPTDGHMHTGWLDYKNKRCYLDGSGRALCDCIRVIDGKTYQFDKGCYATEISSEGKKELDGCDVASYQAGIDFAKMTTTDFAIVKGTQGLWYVNPYADIQYSGAKAAGKLLGMYHYAEGKDPIAEARYFVRKVGGRVGECILALDWEGHDNGKFNSDAEVAWVLKFAMEVYRLTKVHIFLYMSKSVTRRRNWTEVAKDVRLWCAQYANQDHTDYKSNPWTDNGGFGAWKYDTIRQYSSKGRVAGYGKDLDINRAYMSKAEWMAAAAGKNTVVAESPKTQWSAYVSMTTSPVKISNSGSDENGKYKGGKAGDQTGKEWRIRDWYNYPWNCVLRHPLAEVRACLATMAVKAAENDNIGYDQLQRDDYGIELDKNDYDPSKIKKPVESDCSKGVIDNTKGTGHTLGIPELQNINATYTGNMRASYKAAGFYVLTDKKYLTSSDYLLAGDILLNDKHHTCTVITNGSKSGDTVVMPLVKKGSTGAALIEGSK